MVILVFDRVKDTGEELSGMLKEMYGEDSVHFFRDRDGLIRFCERHIFHVLFFCVSGETEKDLLLSEEAMHLIPEVNLILLYRDDSLISRALKIHASGYIRLPVTREKVESEMDNLLFPVYESLPEIRIEEGDKIKVYINDTPVRFSYEKTARLLNLLLDRRGGMLSTGEMINGLWEEDRDIEKSRSYLQNIRSDLLHTLSRYGLKDVVKHRRGRMWMDTGKFRV